MAAYKSEVLDHTYAGQAAAALALRAGLAAPVGAADHPVPAAGVGGEPDHRHPGSAADRALERGGGPAAAAAPVRRPAGTRARGQRVARRGAGDAGKPGAGLGGLVLGLLHRRRGRGRGRRAAVGRVRPAVPGPDRLLRADLDQHRPARGSPTTAAAEPGRAAPVRGRGRARSSGWSRPAPRSGAATPPSCCPTSRGWPRWPPGCSRWPSCWPVRRTGHRPTCPRSRSWPSRTATTPPCWAGRPTPQLLKASGATVTTLGGCCGLAGNFGVEKGHYDVSVKVAEHDLLPAVRGPPGRGRAGRRVLLPHPAGRAGRHARPSPWPSCWPGTRLAAPRIAAAASPEAPTSRRSGQRVDAEPRLVRSQRGRVAATDASGRAVGRPDAGRDRLRRVRFHRREPHVPAHRVHPRQPPPPHRVRPGGDDPAAAAGGGARWSSRRAGCCGGATTTTCNGCSIRAVCWAVRCGCTSATPACSCSTACRRAAGLQPRSVGWTCRARTPTIGRWRSSCIARATTVFGLQRWQAFLIAAGKALRATSRWVPASAVSDFEGELAVLAAAPTPAPVREALLRLRAGAGRARSGATSAGGRLPPVRPCSSRCCRR